MVDNGRLRQRIRREALAVPGLVVGFLTGLVGLGYLLSGGIASLAVLAFPRARDRVLATLTRGAQRLTDVERWRLARFFDGPDVGRGSDARAVRYLALRSGVGILGAAVLFLVLFGAVGAPGVFAELLVGPGSGGWKLLAGGYLVFFGAVLLYLAVVGLVGVAALERGLARRLLGPSREEQLVRRVATLATTRAEVVEAINDERRRIERDLHDGVQQRLVALGMLIARARRGDPSEGSRELLTEAHQECQLALRDLRDAAWRVYPAALDAGGLRAALDMVADRAGLPVVVHYALSDRPGEAVETAAYFVASEAVTNAAKHSGATGVSVHLGSEGERVVLRVSDDGRGGARPDGAGLSGLARRVAALDGELKVHSPTGGPTTITAELPCE